MHDDADIESLIARLAGPLPSTAARVAFREAAETLIKEISCAGPGIAYRTLADLQRQFFVPPDSRRAAWDISCELERLCASKLANGPPLAYAGDGRTVRYRRLRLV
jgi:hypothetical protein